MEQLLHAGARATPAVRRAIQASTESLAKLAVRYGLDPKTVAKWRARATAQDAPMGPKAPRSAALTPAEEAAVVAFRRYARLPLDDCLYVLKDSVPALSRSALHRLFQRYGISQLPVETPPAGAAKKKFKAYPIGYFHLDFAELHTAEGKQYLFVAIDRTSKWAKAELAPEATVAAAVAFWERVVAIVPYKIHTVLTDNGVQFAALPHRVGPVPHLFAQCCAGHGIEHRRTKVAHPWTNGQVERLNRTLKEATVNQFFYETTQQLNDHLQSFLLVYNAAKRLRKLKGLTPHEYVCAEYQKNPSIFTRDPTHDFPGPNT